VLVVGVGTECRLTRDNFFPFWFRFIFRNMSHHEIGDYKYIGDKIRLISNSAQSS
jgi:AAA+ ATPase superfamily predicted ATPase